MENEPFTLLYKLENKALVLERVAGGSLFCESCGDGVEAALCFLKQHQAWAWKAAKSVLCIPSRSSLEAEVGTPRFEQILCAGQKHQKTRMFILGPRSWTMIAFLTTSASMSHHESLV